MFRIAVCDPGTADARELVNRVQSLAQELRFPCTVEAFRTGRALLDAMPEKKYGLIYLETEIGNLSGIDLAAKIRYMGYDTDFVFVTSKEEYALAAYSVFPLGYVLKPLTQNKLKPAFAWMVKNRKALPSVKFRTMSGGEMIVSCDDIIYMEVFRTEIDVHCRQETVKCVGSLTGAMAALPEREFYRSHRNAIVHLGHIAKIGKYYFGMDNGETVTVAKNRYAEAKAVFEKYLSD
ncbi:MAG: LytTR family DNA-binding domain-containing protein [Clostridia bacterium]|nr:LytTR family DNA-binding domain-containing protein [Clostridia bacterium]